MKLSEIEEISKWLNEWGDFNKHNRSIRDGKRTDFGDGYEQAIKDIFNKFKVFEDKLHLSLKKWQQWSKEEEKLVISMYNNNCSYIEIAKTLNRSLSSVTGRINWFCLQRIIIRRGDKRSSSKVGER